MFIYAVTSLFDIYSFTLTTDTNNNFYLILNLSKTKVFTYLGN